MSPTCILHPPASGWSDTRISTSALRLTGRNSTVITLLKHLPYLSPKLQIWSDETCPISYLDQNHDVEVVARELARGRKWGALCPFMPFDEETDVPGGMVCLTEGDGGSWWMVDTDAGVVYPYAWGEYWDYEVDESLLVTAPWLRYKAVGIEAFFDRLQEGLLGLEVVALPGFVRERKGGVKDKIEHEVCPAGYPEGKSAKNVFLEHGWPDLARFRREECVRAVNRARSRVLDRRAIRWCEESVRDAEKMGDGMEKERKVRELGERKVEYEREWEEDAVGGL
jgi:hypothetical protein